MLKDMPVSEEPPDARSMPISEFRRNCLSLLPAVAESGGEIIVTRRGEPLAVVSAIPRGGTDSIYGLYSDGEIAYPNPTAPCYSDEKWDEIIDAQGANAG